MIGCGLPPPRVGGERGDREPVERRVEHYGVGSEAFQFVGWRTIGGDACPCGICCLGIVGSSEDQVGWSNLLT